jgi:hypothetical protein
MTNVSAGGTIKAVECIEMELGEPDSRGRRRPVPKKGSEHTIDVDGNPSFRNQTKPTDPYENSWFGDLKAWHH